MTSGTAANGADGGGVSRALQVSTGNKDHDLKDGILGQRNAFKDDLDPPNNKSTRVTKDLIRR